MELKNVHLTRQADWLDSSLLGKKIVLIGAGAVGSFTALMLAKTGFHNIEVWDDDTVSEENIGPQFYRFSDIGKPKVQALKDMVKDFTNIDIKAVNERYEKGIFEGIVIMAVDSMEVRKTIWENHKFIGLKTDMIIDSRMAVQTALLFVVSCMNKKDVDDYEKSLYEDGESVQERCTLKATSSTSCLIAGMITKVVRDVVMGEKYIRTMQWDIAKNKQLCFSLKD